MRRFGTRARQRTGTARRRTRALTLAAAVTAVSVAGVAILAQRSGDGPDGRWRHGHHAGAVTPGSTAPETTGGSRAEPSSAPTIAADAAGPAATTPRPTGGSGTTAAPPPAPGGAAPTGPRGTTGPPGTAGTTPRPGQPPTTLPWAPGTGATGRAAAPGWHLLPEAPVGGRDGHTAVWTGREMVVWGGTGDFDADPSTDGAAFDPAGRAWRNVPAAPLSPRFDARAVWTGREMIVFGGGSLEGDVLSDGAAWDPVTNAWRRLPASPLGLRDGAVVAWAGDRLVVWGGSTVPAADAPPDAETEMRNDGAAYVPATDRWVPLAAAPIPGRSWAESGWTGSRLVISGGHREGDDEDRTDGVALDPVSGAWSPIAARPEPGSCGGPACEGVWTGRGVLFAASGLLYDPAGDRWSVLAPSPEVDGPAPGQPAAWAGGRLLVWGIAADGDGSDDGPAADEETGTPSPNAGAMYDPATDEWDLFPGGPLRGREGHTVVWSGEEMLVWGGTVGDGGLGDGAAYRPQ